MARIILALLLFGAVVTIFKLVVLGLILAGLIFRTKETTGLLLIGGTITLISKYPLVGWLVVCVVVVVAIAKAMRSDPPNDGSTALERFERVMQEKNRLGD